MKKLSRRVLLRYGSVFIGGLVIGQWVGRLFGLKSHSLDNINLLSPKNKLSSLNDASGLSETPVFRHKIIQTSTTTELLKAIRSEVLAAQEGKRPFSIGNARHSMGGQAIPRNGHAITLDNAHIEVDSKRKVYRITGGVCWKQVIAKLDPLGFSPKVMQSNNDFGVISTFCVNAHGWPVSHGPMGTTVRSFEMVLSNGESINCSRTQNSDLFSMTMGGYGLTGAIYSMELDMVSNMRLEPHFEEVPTSDFSQKFMNSLLDSKVNMAYGRLNVDKSRFFEEALLVTYRETKDQSQIPQVHQRNFFSNVSRYVLRSQLENEKNKHRRWWLETKINPIVHTGITTRNTLINEPVVALDDRDPNRTDILHEYFFNPDQLGDFIRICKDLIPSSYQELLNITLRFVDHDSESWLCYAPEPRIAAVLLFSQEMTERAEADMKRLTQALIEGVLSINGSYYLPYRPHPTSEQFLRAYPLAKQFASSKKKLDPNLTFRNNFWDNYFSIL